MPRPLLATLALLVALAPSPRAQVWADDHLERTWETLSVGERRELAEWFGFEVQVVATARRRLVDRVLQSLDVDPGFWPTAGPRPIFEPGGRRSAVAPGSPEEAAFRERLGLESERRLWTYDPATRRLVRHGPLRDPDRVFREALRGRSPECEWAVAEVTRRLDDGAQLDAHAALAHAWSDDSGAVVPSISLYEVLAADPEARLSEVDARNVVRFVDGDPPADAPPATREELDRRVREIFETARERLAFTESLARLYLEADAELPPEHGEPLHLHALWVAEKDDPEAMRERVPAAGELTEFLEFWRESFRRNRLRTGAIYRQRDLVASGPPVRLLLERLMEDFGAFEPREPASTPEPEVVAAAAEPTDDVPVLDTEGLAELRERFARLRKRKQHDVLEACREAALAADAPQVELVSLWTGRLEGERDELPGPTKLEPHDAKVYGGGPPRRTIGPGHRRWEHLDPQVSHEAEPPAHRRYDFELATGLIVDLERERDAATELDLLLEGRLPDEDLARAVLLSRLDTGGRLRQEAFFFAHPYTDRDGYAYEGITLGEMWSSDVELEVPDVDALAFIREIWHDASVKPPLDGSDHAKWYPRISDALARVRHRKHVTAALAAVWFDGRPELTHGYDASIDLLHALIARCGENADRVSERLERDGQRLLQVALKEVVALGDEAWNEGNRRRDGLELGRARIRAAVLGAIAEAGLLGE